MTRIEGVEKLTPIWYTESGAMKTKTSLVLRDEDYEAIAKIKQWYGIKTDAEAIRRALRIATKSRPRGKREVPQKAE